MEKNLAPAAPTWRALGIQLLDKYDVGEREHSLHVEKLALRLFDGIEDACDCSEDDRRLLQYAALTHDTGHYIDGRGHHRHSAYLIASDVASTALPERAREEAAWLALNHRKRKMLEADRWDKGRLQRLSRLALLLRIADVLDYDHEQNVDITHVAYHRPGNRLDIEVVGFPAARYEKKFLRKASFSESAGLASVRLQSGSEIISS